MFRTASIVALVVFLLTIGADSSIAQSGESDYKAAYGSALAANTKAGELKNQWTRTGSSLVAAHKAAAAGDYAQAVQFSREAEALANASIAQTEREKTLWKESEIH
jgi:hypothetical protein